MYDRGMVVAALHSFAVNFWKLLPYISNDQLLNWHYRFATLGYTNSSPLLAASLMPTIGAPLRFSLAQFAEAVLGVNTKELQNVALRLQSRVPGIVEEAIRDSNRMRKEFDDSTGYRISSAKYVPYSAKIASIIYDSGLDNFEQSRYVEVMPYYRESEMLRARIEAHRGKFDALVLVEGSATYQGKPKESYFLAEFDDSFRRRHNIRHIIVDFPETSDPWVRERLQRDAPVLILGSLDMNAFIYSSDLDE
ncbi:MAG: hypothetical protein M0019_02790 [Actinomycetota bacterium]|nr:hypothetical protein [Actinomycetota bacterium]